MAERYPDAVNVKWTSKNGYDVAKFNRVATRSANAGYDFPYGSTAKDSGAKDQSEISYNELPEAVKTAFQASEYADWKVDDIDKLRETAWRPSMSSRSRPFAGNIEKEADLYYSEEGALIKTVVEMIQTTTTRTMFRQTSSPKSRNSSDRNIPWSSNHRYRI